MSVRNHNLRPKIINADSDFVVITYWWGRGNKNKNTQRPCPEDMESDDDTLTTNPVTYDKMISNWVSSCKKSKCNYLVEEYPEFAKKGMYQRAINFKPNFIKDALHACYPRSVLYIDGDMCIKKYPAIFDTPDIDFMGQGWNSDPRFRSWQTGNNPCYYPYVFETSGGTMYFSQSRGSKYLLNEWNKIVKKHPLKAEDRLISQLFNNKHMLTFLNIIQLPLEYLWLSIDYDEMSKTLYKPSNVKITHPACLTGEDRAYQDGAARDRYPPRYDYHVTDHVDCTKVKNMPFYEFIYFDKKTNINQMDDWMRVMNRWKLIKRIPYNSRYGAELNKVADKNKKIVTVDCIDKTVQNTVHILPSNSDACGYQNIHKLLKNENLMAVTAAYLKNGTDVVYVPRKSTNRNVETIKRHASKVPDAVLVCKNTNKSKRHYKAEYMLKIDSDYPVYMKAGSSVLEHLTIMSKDLSAFSKIFSGSFIFPSRIRCEFV